MYHWITDVVADEMRKLPLVKNVIIAESGGDYDTSRVLVEPLDSDDIIFVSGYVDTENVLANPDNTDIRWVEVTDGRDSSGGLSSDNENTALIYVQIRKFFRANGVDVINHYSEIF